VEAIGKHLVVHTSRDWSLRTHLGMTGSWHVYAPGEPWRLTPGKARVILGTEHAVAVCFAAPSVELAPTERVLAGLQRLGPDLTGDAPDVAEAVRRARSATAPTLADLLLDQHVAAGIGNVFKSEVLFLAGLHPDTPPGDLDDAALTAIYDRAARLLRGNVGSGRRTTTGSRARERHWVYGRGGRPCRRCGTAIASAEHGPLRRISYWCRSCQPPSASVRSRSKG
jgi:endonuclease-8